VYYKKEYNNNEYRGKRSFDGKFGRRKPHAILPPPSILRAYDEISEGAADRLIEMAEYEQSHRHEWENEALVAYGKSHRLGQVCGVFVAMGVLAASLYASEILKDNMLAMAIAVSGFVSMMVSTIFAAKNKRYEMRVRRPYSERKWHNNEEEETKEE